MKRALDRIIEGQDIGQVLESLNYKKMLPIINKWVSLGRLDAAERKLLIEFITNSTTKSRHLERISNNDEGRYAGDVISFEIAAFTSVKVSEGQSAGQITWKSSDECIYILENARRGYDIDYKDIQTLFGAASEKETLITGRYEVQKVENIVEPGTNPTYGYTIKAYFIKQI